MNVIELNGTLSVGRANFRHLFTFSSVCILGATKKLLMEIIVVRQWAVEVAFSGLVTPAVRWRPHAQKRKSFAAASFAGAVVAAAAAPKSTSLRTHLDVSRWQSACICYLDISSVSGGCCQRPDCGYGCLARWRRFKDVGKKLALSSLRARRRTISQ